MNQIFYLCAFTRDENTDILSEDEAINEIEYYEYILKVTIISNNRLQILDIIHISNDFKQYNFLSVEIDKEDNVFYEKVINIYDTIKYLINFNLDNLDETLKQIENYNNIVYINSFHMDNKNNYKFDGYKLFNVTKIICLKSLKNIQDQFVKNSKLLQERL
jgi:hypothetical protein